MAEKQICKTLIGHLKDFRSLSHQLLEQVNRQLPPKEFFNEVLRLIENFTGTDDAQLWLVEGERVVCHGVIDESAAQNVPAPALSKEDFSGSDHSEQGIIRELCGDVLHGNVDHALPCFTTKGSFWTGDIDSHLLFAASDPDHVCQCKTPLGYKSLALVPLTAEDERLGLLLLQSSLQDFFTEEEVEYCEDIVQLLSLALVTERSRVRLSERVKELTCLYGIAQLAAQHRLSLGGTLQAIVNLLPPAWQYPHITCARIILDGFFYNAPKNIFTPVRTQSSDIIVNNIIRGCVEVGYQVEMPTLDEGPFLKEERNLLDTVSKQIELIVARTESQEEKSRLQKQILHADRLATIGQLSAGVAHELNEPLGAILGFAQLLQKDGQLSEKAGKDAQKIVNASLHAREIVRKLMLFARQKPPEKTCVNLNKIIEEGLFFLESRCAKENITLVRELDPLLPDITVDQAQIHQVLVNLAVNAVQAMPDGGTVTIRTKKHELFVVLSVEDTGVGIPDDVRDKIFLPFFTTKELDKGTGLGLSVAHGIVSSHGGFIKFNSREKQGTCFDIYLPTSAISAPEAK